MFYIDAILIENKFSVVYLILTHLCFKVKVVSFDLFLEKKNLTFLTDKNIVVEALRKLFRSNR